MERIVYRKTLDVHKNGVQFLLQGFETADKLSRVIEISLMASGDAIDLPLEGLVAVMYVTTPEATEPSINKCTIKDNKIIYEVLPITEEGITELKLKLIETGPNGTTSVLASPKFAVEVTESGMNDDGEELNQKFTATAIEDAIAKAETAYWKRCERIELDNDCMFKAYYADGTYYETDILKELFVEGTVKLSQSYAKGGTGIRAGEDTDNSMYYSNVARSEAINAKSIMENSEDILEEVKTHGIYTAFSIDFETGEAVYVSPSFKFRVNTESGEMEAEGHNYTFNDDAGKYVEYWLASNGIVIADLQAIASTHTEEIGELQNRITPIEKGGTGADNNYDARTNLDVYSKDETASKTTLGLFGLGEGNSPNVILSMLGSHWWRRRTVESGYALDGGEVANPNSYGFSFSTNFNDVCNIFYSDSVTVTADGITLNNPKKIIFNRYDIGGQTFEVDELKGKYFRHGSDTEPLSRVFKGDDNSIQASIISNALRLTNITVHRPKYYEINGEWEYLHSTNKDEYTEGTDGMFEYEYLGVPYKNAIDAKKNTEDILNTLAGGVS